MLKPTSLKAMDPTQTYPDEDEVAIEYYDSPKEAIKQAARASQGRSAALSAAKPKAAPSANAPMSPMNTCAG